MVVLNYIICSRWVLCKCVCVCVCVCIYNIYEVAGSCVRLRDSEKKYEDFNVNRQLCVSTESER